MSLEQRFAGRALVLGVVPHDEPDSIQAWERARELGAANRTLFDPDADAVRSLGISGEPTILLLDAAGSVVREYDWVELVSDSRLPNPLDGEALHAWLESIIAADLELQLRE